MITQPVQYFQFSTQLEQYYWIAKEVDRLVKDGHDTAEIAIISRRHASLSELVKIFQEFNISVYYERGQNVLEKPYIHQLLTILRFINSLNKKNQLEADEYLPEILSYPFWEISRPDLWKLSVFAYSQKNTHSKLWLEAMQNADEIRVSETPLEDPAKFKKITTFFFDLARQAKTEPVERIIDQILGTDDDPILEDDQDKKNTETSQDQNSEVFKTNFKKYYFSDELNQQELTSKSIHFLSDLRTLVQSIRQFQIKQTLYLPDVLEMIELLKKNNLPLINNSPFGAKESGVNLLTAHKAKGLEFETVFVVDCVQDEWFGRRTSTKLDLPMNLPLLPDKDDRDDQLRLVYVAITRAKNQVNLTSFSQKEDKTEVLPIDLFEQMIAHSQLELVDKKQSESEILDTLQTTQKTSQETNFVDQERNLLGSILSDYQLSVTHLNNFLDVTRGGPRRFLEQNLLRFPQAKSPAAAYGSAMHAAIRAFLEESKTLSRPASKEFLLEMFSYFLKLERLNEKELIDFINIGNSNLGVYFEYKKDHIGHKVKLEFSFASQEVCVGNARLTGQIDLIQFLSNSEIVVTDFKTGKPTKKWTDTKSKVKLWKYQNQLLFYKILVENSYEFGGKYKVNFGQLEFLDAHKLTTPEIVCLQSTLDNEKTESLKLLVEIVYNKIMSLDFPDTSKYTQDHKGIMAFCDDLISGKV